MDVERFWFPPELEEMGARPTGSRHDQLLFLSAQVGRDLATGQVVRRIWDIPDSAVKALTTGLEHADGREGPAKAQTWTIYQNLSKILESQGSSLDQVIRQRIYLKHPSDISPMEETMLGFFPGEKPATTISCISSVGIHDDLLVEVEVVALIPKADGATKVGIHLPELEALTQPYPQAVRVGQLLFFSGILGIIPSTGRVATNLGEVAELAERARNIMATGRYNSDVVAEPFKAQLAVVFAHMERVLASQGATIDDVLRHNYLTTMGMREWGLASMVYRPQLYSSKSAAPTSTCVTVPYINSDPDVVLVSDSLALLPGEWKKEGMLDPETDMAHLPMTIAAGPYVFHTGYIAMDKELHGPIRHLSELHDEGRFLGQTQFDSAEALVAQAWFTYREVNGMLQRAGTDLSRVVQQTVLMRDASDYAIIEQTVAAMFRGAVPPTTVIACDDIGPYPGLLFEVEAVAVR